MKTDKKIPIATLARLRLGVCNHFRSRGFLVQHHLPIKVEEDR